MLPVYRYQIWDGKKQIGVFTSSRMLLGNHLSIPLFPAYKEPYKFFGTRDIILPLEWINTENSHNYKTFELVVVVKTKSKKQRAAIIQAGGAFYT